MQYIDFSCQNSKVKLWDLRKLKIFKTLTLSDSFIVRHVSFDSSGTYLSVAGNDLRIFKVKDIDKSGGEVGRFGAHQDQVTCARFGHLATEIISSSLDRTIKVFSLES